MGLTFRTNGLANADRAASTVHPPLPHPARHTTGMAIRVGVQADSEEECAEGLARLVDAGFVPVMMPKYLTDGR